MGQKVNPIGLRLGINRGWDSIWFSKKADYGKFLIEDYKIREYVKKNVVNSGISQVIIERTSKKCIISIYTSRPGFVIGKKGSDIDKIKKTVQSAVANAENNNQYDIDNLYIKEAYVGKSIVLKRFRPRAKGRASGIKKPYSNLTIILSEDIKNKEKSI